MSELMRETDFLNTILEMVTDGIYEYIPQEDTFTLYRVAGRELVREKEIKNFRSFFCESVDEVSHSRVEEMFRMVDSREEEASFEIKLKREYSGKKFIWVVCYLNYERQGDFYVGFIKGIDDRINENMKLYEEARKDSLTKLVNKAYSTQMIQDAMARSGRGTLMIIDIDNFKSVNDTMGHLFGDEVIVSVANGLRSVFRQSDIVGRIGGDEFIVFLENVTDRVAIRKKAEDICDRVLKIYTGENERVKISASVGISIMPDDGMNYNELFKRADYALYYTKNKGKNGFSFFDKDNEEMQKHHRVTEKKNDYSEEVEEVNEEMDSFYFELNELAFRLLQETKDADSAINLLLHKIQNKFGFSSIRVLEPAGSQNEFACTYELCSGNIHQELGQQYTYTEAQWIKLKSLCSSGTYVYRKSETQNAEEEIFKAEDNVKSGVVVSISNNGCLAGIILYIDSFRERGFSKKELKVLKSFERVFSVYKARKNSIENADIYLKQLSERDNLTGLYKYSAFMNKMEETIYSITSDFKLVYLHADIAHFKYINESYGYDVGDKLLKSFAELMCSAFSGLLYGSRIHSDNIVIVFQTPASVPDQKIIDTINEGMPEKNAVLQSIIASENFYINSGVYIAGGSDHKYDRGITNASYARKLSKENGDGRCVWFDNDMFEEHRKEMQLLDDFPEALKLQKFDVYYQPQIDTISKTVVGAEALSRWIREDGTVMMPDEFIGVLESTNKLAELDYYVMNKVFEFIQRQKDILSRTIPISVNLSKRHIKEEEFFDRLKKLLEKYHVDGKYVSFEIKEEVFINDLDAAVSFCNRLKEMGISVMMDSFGNGYSSLNVLDKIPVECIKIDKLFIKNNVFAKNEEVILNGIVDIAKKLQKSIASMGVETFEQNAFLCRCGCDIIQGNYYSEPLEESELLEYIEEHSKPEINFAYFKFDGNFDGNEACYTANANGSHIGFDENELPGRKVLALPGGLVGHELIELSLENLLTNDFTISMWFNDKAGNMWSSLFYADFENGFVSIMPKAWNGLSLMRVMDKSEDMGYYDAVSTEKSISGWTYIAAAYNATTHSSAIFINGFLTGYKNDVLRLKNPGRIALGGDVYQPSFQGFVADLRVTNTALSAKDVREEYEREKNKFIKK